MAKDYLLLALKNVRKRGIRSWLTMLGVFVGIAAVVSLISLGQGLQTAITGQFGALSLDTLLVQGADTGFAPPGTASVSKMTEREREIIASISGVNFAIARYLRAGTAEFNDVRGFGFASTIPEDKDALEEVYQTLNLGVEDGKRLETDDHSKILIGNDFKKEDLFGKAVRVGSKIKVDGKDFEVIGILERSSNFGLNGAILMTEKDLKDLKDIPDDEIDFIVTRVEDPDEIENIAEEIARKLRRERGQKLREQDFEVQTPIQNLETVNTILNVINIVVIGIALISLLVGGIGIANTMFTSVLERTKEIGVMKAIGAQNKDILSIFLIEAGFLGLVGGIIGAAIGLTMAFAVSLIANSALGTVIFTINPSVPLILGSIGFSLLIGVLSGVIPALQASKLNPVEALRS